MVESRKFYGLACHTMNHIRGFPELSARLEATFWAALYYQSPLPRFESLFVGEEL